MTQPNTIMIGAYAGGLAGMVTLASILDEGKISSEPDCKFTDFAGFQDAEDTSRRGLGYAMCEMNWTSLSDTQRYTLRQFCPSKLSAQVFIRVSTNETNSAGVHIWHTYLATMLWITGAETRTIYHTDQDPGVWEGAIIQFRALIQQD